MEPCLVLLLCLASHPVGHAFPKPVIGADFTDTFDDFTSTPDDDVQENNIVKINDGMTDIAADYKVEAVSNIIQRVNKGDTLLIEGDIAPILNRSAQKCTKCQWQKSQDGIAYVPYVVSAAYRNFDRSMIVKAMKEYEVMTCVQFINRTTEKDFLFIDNKSGCWSFVGKVGGRQAVSLSLAGCIKYNLIQHELMHTLGFNHEFTRKDRDDYIGIIWENIASGDRSIFKIDDGDLQNMSYDYYSILHYEASAFSKVSGEPSMVQKCNLTEPMGKAIGLDDLDVMKVNDLYDCNLCRKKLFAPGSTTYDSSSLGQGTERCLYLIQSFLKVRLQLSNISFPSSPDCKSAYIKVYDGVSPSSPVLLDRICGRKSVPPLVSSEEFILIEIVNNQQLAQSNFKASFEIERYGNTFVQDNGEVTSPGLYPSNVSIVYSIIAPTGYQVQLNFSFFWIKYSPSCSEEYLTIMDGVLEKILATYCGLMDTFAPLVSTWNSMVLLFNSEDSAGFNGFYAKYKFVTTR